MDSYKTALTCAALALLLAGIRPQAESLQEFGEIQGRSYHAELYAAPPCVACHGEERPSSFPADDVCLDCHDGEDLVTATARAEDERWQNPHDNLHYGKDVPCMECHGEHETRKPLCQGCHSFKYSKYKP